MTSPVSNIFGVMKWVMALVGCVAAINATAQTSRHPSREAWAAIEQRNTRAAIRLLTSEARQCEIETRDPKWCLNIYNEIISEAFATNDYPLALTYSAAIVRILELMPDKTHLARYLLPYADALRLNGHHKEQRAAIDKSMSILESSSKLDVKSYTEACARLITTGWIIEGQKDRKLSSISINTGIRCLNRIRYQPGSNSFYKAILFYRLGYTYINRGDNGFGPSEYFKAVDALNRARSFIESDSEMYSGSSLRMEVLGALARAKIGSGHEFPESENLMLAAYKIGDRGDIYQKASASDLAFDFYRAAKCPLRASLYLKEALSRFKMMASMNVSTESSRILVDARLHGRYRALVTESWEAAKVRHQTQC